MREAREIVAEILGSVVEHSSMPIYLGVDGGGSKTTAAIATEDRLLATATHGASNALRLPEAQVRASLHGAILEACEKASITPDAIDFACVGAAGSSRPPVRDKVQQIVGEVVNAPIQVVGDMHVAHAGAFFGAAGLVVIAGTGSIAFARNARGETARAGGWGSVISDEGSGYWIGRRAVAAAMRGVDSGQSTSLITRIMHVWRIATREEVSTVGNGVPAPEFAALFPEVQAAASEGDLVASEILAEAGSELATLAKVVMRKMWPGQQQVNIAMVGGIFRHSPTIRQVFYNSVRSERAEAKVRFCTMPPVYGAVYLARQMLSAATPANGGLA